MNHNRNDIELPSTSSLKNQFKLIAAILPCVLFAYFSLYYPDHHQEGILVYAAYLAGHLVFFSSSHYCSFSLVAGCTTDTPIKYH